MTPVRSQEFYDSVDSLIEQARELYYPLFKETPEKISGGRKLLKQFEDAASPFQSRQTEQWRHISERINEMAVAFWLNYSDRFVGGISYEPDILPNGRKIDFVINGPMENTYIEVKTVHPQQTNDETNWVKGVQRRSFAAENAVYLVEREWLGAEIYDKSFKARAKFLEYSIDFEDRLHDAQTNRVGNGILVFCGNGLDWHLSELEDFADFYMTGLHRADDHFSNMERRFIADNEIKLRRNICNFAVLQRLNPYAAMSQIVFPVRGPKRGFE